jgi:hypothetical protein
MSLYRSGWPDYVRTLADDMRDHPRPVDTTPHVHFHEHDGRRHAHTHVHPEPHAHSTLTGVRSIEEVGG